MLNPQADAHRLHKRPRALHRVGAHARRPALRALFEHDARAVRQAQKRASHVARVVAHGARGVAPEGFVQPPRDADAPLRRGEGNRARRDVVAGHLVRAQRHPAPEPRDAELQVKDVVRRARAARGDQHVHGDVARVVPGRKNRNARLAARVFFVEAEVSRLLGPLERAGAAQDHALDHGVVVRADDQLPVPERRVYLQRADDRGVRGYEPGDRGAAPLAAFRAPERGGGLLVARELDQQRLLSRVERLERLARHRRGRAQGRVRDARFRGETFVAV